MRDRNEEEFQVNDMGVIEDIKEDVAEDKSEKRNLIERVSVKKEKMYIVSAHTKTGANKTTVMAENITDALKNVKIKGEIVKIVLAN